MIGDDVAERAAVARALKVKICFALIAFVPGDLHAADDARFAKVKLNPLPVAPGAPTGAELAIGDVRGGVGVLRGAGGHGGDAHGAAGEFVVGGVAIYG